MTLTKPGRFSMLVVLLGTALISTAVTAAAGAAVAPVSTKTVLSISQVSLGLSGGGSIDVDAQQWTAKVTAHGARVALKGSAVSFVLSEGGAILATFVTRAGRSDCSFKTSISATSETIQSVAPDICSGGTAGYVQLTGAQISSPTIAVRAVYAGATGFKASRSGIVNNENVAAGQTVSS